MNEPRKVKKLIVKYRDGSRGIYEIDTFQVKKKVCAFSTTNGGTHIVPLDAIKEMIHHDVVEVKEDDD